MFKSRKLAIVFCLSMLVIPVIFAESITEKCDKFAVVVRPGQVIGSMFKAGLLTIIADIFVPLTGTPARIIDLSIFSLFSYHYMRRAYITELTQANSPFVEKNKK